ncbi:MAG: trigger factor [Acidobacteriota bacterium]|nr:trigger factor [Acidobacteriota bacterium]
MNETAVATPAHDHEHDHAGHTHSHGPALNPELSREIAVEVPADEVSKSFKTVVKRYQKLARIPGFRAGKVPETLIRSKFSKEIRQEVLEQLVSARFREEINSRGLKPVSEPQLLDLQLNDGQPLQFKAAFEVAPEISIEGYETVTIARPDVALTDDEYEMELSRVLDSHATVEPVEEERALVDGDWAEIRFEGKVKDLAQTVTEDGLQDAAAQEPISGDDVLLEIGGKNTLPAFTEALRGAKPGQELTFEVSYPAEFGEARLAGQTVGYDVTVKAIKRKTYPEKDAEFAKQMGNYESWDEFEAKLREHAANRKKEALENRAKDQLLEQLIAKFTFPVPEAFIERQIDARLDRGLRALAQQGMSMEDMRKLDFPRLRAAQRDQAVNEVKASLVLDRIAEAEGVTVADEDVDRELFMLSIQSREPLDTLRERLKSDGGLDRIREQMRREKTGNLLYEKLSA